MIILADLALVREKVGRSVSPDGFAIRWRRKWKRRSSGMGTERWPAIGRAAGLEEEDAASFSGFSVRKKSELLDAVPQRVATEPEQLGCSRLVVVRPRK